VSHGAGRFTGRVDDYVRARPSYPHALLTLLHEACGLGASSVVADLGSGTGLFTRLLLDTGATVHGVEPNEEMRAAAEAMLGGATGFRSVAGAAEATTLPDASVDLVTAAQAFHWFDTERTRVELDRILRVRGDRNTASNVALVWNDRELSSDAFHHAYEELLVRRCPKYLALQGKADTTEKFDTLLGAGAWRRISVPNEQRLDREGLAGRLLSSSYAPRPGEPGHDETFAELRAMFDRHAARGSVTMRYATVAILGRPR
jgi:SAM-dependent methyltransferase